MTETLHPAFATPETDALPLWLVAPDMREGLKLKADHLAWLTAQGFKGARGELVLLPGAKGALAGAVLGVGASVRPRTLNGLVHRLPEGVWRVAAQPKAWDPAEVALAFAEGVYAFTAYKKGAGAKRRLALAPKLDVAALSAVAQASDLARDLINTPPVDMGPVALEAAARKLAAAHGAMVSVTSGGALAADYPLVHAVGQAASEAPRMIELNWRGSGAGQGALKLAVVGKGVTFDSGGLNIKVGGGMRLMKKDMGGAAHALALAQLVMAADLPLAMSVLIPAAENAIGPGAFRPGDIVRSRKGLTVEIEDTDAEGRLILADALARAGELGAEVVVDFATLTGAARVALGPDLPPFYTRSEPLAAELNRAAAKVDDPLWRMPLWDGYADQLRSPIADLKNLGDPGMAGSMTAALFLERFVSAATWVHFDVYAWQTGGDGRTAGGALQAVRAVFEVVASRSRQG